MKIVHKGLVDYLPTFEAMKAFNASRDENTEDELWVVEHPPVFTQGLAGKPEHLLIRDDIPVVQIDRGGQITYHGPGQLVVYTMINFKRRKTSVRHIVSALETASSPPWQNTASKQPPIPNAPAFMSSSVKSLPSACVLKTAPFTTVWRST